MADRVPITQVLPPPAKLKDADFLASIESFRRLKVSVRKLIDLALSQDGQMAVELSGEIQKQITSFESNYLLCNADACGAVKSKIDATYTRFYTDVSADAIKATFASLQAVLNESPDLINLLFLGYLEDKTNQLAGFIIKQFRIFWTPKGWNTKARMTAEIRKQLQGNLVNNCNLLKFLIESPTKLALKMNVDTIRELLQSLLPFLVLCHSKNTKTETSYDYTRNIPVELGCFDFIPAMLFSPGLNSLDLNSLTISLIQIIRDFITQTKDARTREPYAVAYYFDLNDYPSLFSSYGYRPSKKEINQFYVALLVDLFSKYYQQFKALPQVSFDGLNLDAILFELYNLFEVLYSEPINPELESISRLICALTSRITKRFKDTIMENNFTLIDRDLKLLGDSAIARNELKLVGYMKNVIIRKHKKKSNNTNPFFEPTGNKEVDKEPKEHDDNIMVVLQPNDHSEESIIKNCPDLDHSAFSDGSYKSVLHFPHNNCQNVDNVADQKDTLNQSKDNKSDNNCEDVPSDDDDDLFFKSSIISFPLKEPEKGPISPNQKNSKKKKTKKNKDKLSLEQFSVDDSVKHVVDSKAEDGLLDGDLFPEPEDEPIAPTAQQPTTPNKKNSNKKNTKKNNKDKLPLEQFSFDDVVEHDNKVGWVFSPNLPKNIVNLITSEVSPQASTSNVMTKPPLGGNSPFSLDSVLPLPPASSFAPKASPPSNNNQMAPAFQPMTFKQRNVNKKKDNCAFLNASKNIQQNNFVNTQITQISPSTSILKSQTAFSTASNKPETVDNKMASQNAQKPSTSNVMPQSQTALSASTPSNIPDTFVNKRTPRPFQKPFSNLRKVNFKSSLDGIAATFKPIVKHPHQVVYSSSSKKSENVVNKNKASGISQNGRFPFFNKKYNKMKKVQRRRSDSNDSESSFTPEYTAKMEKLALEAMRTNISPSSGKTFEPDLIKSKSPVSTQIEPEYSFNPKDKGDDPAKKRKVKIENSSGSEDGQEEIKNSNLSKRQQKVRQIAVQARKKREELDALLNEMSLLDD